MNASGFRRSHSGFSLIELLVVIAIIALLVALLLPALSKARESANDLKCQANLHQIALGFQSYFMDHKMLTVAPTGGSAVTWGGRAGSLAPYSATGAWAPRNRPINPYLAGTEHDNGDAPIFQCPSDRGEPPVPDTTYSLVGTSYIYNAYSPLPQRTLTTTSDRGVPIDIVVKPARTILAADHVSWNYLYGSLDRMQRWHSPTEPSGNYLFVDGHVSLHEAVDRPAEGYDSEAFTWYAQGSYEQSVVIP